MADQKPEMLLLELATKRNSGWVQKGSEGSNPIYRNTSEMEYMDSEGFMGKKLPDGSIQNVKIRYIQGEDEILWDKQEERKLTPRRKDSKIIFHNGFMTVVKSGSTRGLFDYCANVYANENAPNREHSSATVVFRVVDLNKKAEEINESEETVVMALAEVYKLRKKNSKGGYDYDEAKIDSYASVLNIHGGDGPGQKIKAISDFAKLKPEVFMKSITAFNSVVSTEVAHSLELGVIEFEGNVAQYREGNEIIKSLGTQKLNKNQQVDALSDYLKTPDGNEALTKLRAKLEVAKEKNLK